MKITQPALGISYLLLILSSMSQGQGRPPGVGSLAQGSRENFQNPGQVTQRFANRFILEARSCADSGDINRAVGLYSKAELILREGFPDLADEVAAEGEFVQGHFELAARLYRSGHVSGNVEPLYLVICEGRNGRVAEAKKSYDGYLTCATGSEGSVESYPAEILPSRAKLTAQSLTATALCLLSRRIGSNGRAVGAIKLAQQAHSLLPNDPFVNLCLGERLINAKRYAEAMPYLEASRRNFGNRQVSQLTWALNWCKDNLLRPKSEMDKIRNSGT